MDNLGIIIPAREASTRFPGKVLKNILGKPMIQRVWEKCAACYDPEKVWVATDSEKVVNLIKAIGGNAIITDSTCKTGMDRVAQANQTLSFDVVMNVQGDEPILEDDIISDAIMEFNKGNCDVLNCMSEIKTSNEFINPNVIKVVVDEYSNLIYMSRSSVPSSKDFNKKLENVFRQVCVYILSNNALSFFGETKSKEKIESIEDIEILRLLNKNLKIQMLNVNSNSIAVDVPEDILKVEERMITSGLV